MASEPDDITDWHGTDNVSEPDEIPDWPGATGILFIAEDYRTIRVDGYGSNKLVAVLGIRMHAAYLSLLSKAPALDVFMSDWIAESLMACSVMRVFQAYRIPYVLPPILRLAFTPGTDPTMEDWFDDIAEAHQNWMSANAAANYNYVGHWRWAEREAARAGASRLRDGPPRTGRQREDWNTSLCDYFIDDEAEEAGSDEDLDAEAEDQSGGSDIEYIGDAVGSDIEYIGTRRASINADSPGISHMTLVSSLSSFPDDLLPIATPDVHHNWTQHSTLARAAILHDQDELSDYLPTSDDDLSSDEDSTTDYLDELEEMVARLKESALETSSLLNEYRWAH
ncbi:hypothetical protein CONPUDRAFT_152746 [Coniophora puteana RWD-64-598 SS2]|uniref:Uncharacterized protein n=1 Tax=Coniophora puteana (strain RWD-64-598) TaxID=741705 RepID=A0A5M3MSX4_CONPW|nr:uncharacterized protein CONPUDRAFT_152746 [Coniophora puteana RWD-64-598 SS2]EIW81844.1 hypothetical protein CONPUDRAFT_152746 [Coniophora puteana RWD-64-598 SS2]